MGSTHKKKQRKWFEKQSKAKLDGLSKVLERLKIKHSGMIRLIDIWTIFKRKTDSNNSHEQKHGGSNEEVSGNVKPARPYRLRYTHKF